MLRNTQRLFICITVITTFIAASLFFVTPALALNTGALSITLTCTNFSYAAYTLTGEFNNTGGAGAGAENFTVLITDGAGNTIYTTTATVPVNPAGFGVAGSPGTPYTSAPQFNPISLTVTSNAGNGFSATLAYSTTGNCAGLPTFTDGDGDTYSPPADCNDGNAAINPGATDIPGNGIDEDCSGADTPLDADSDTYSPPADCDDNNSAINPGATDIPGNGIDEDCSGADTPLDADSDTYSPPADCDDGNAAINPGATDIPGNGIDEDCSGADTPIDADSDTYSPPADCDDGNAAINPGATEINGNGIDENCDGADGVVDVDGDTYSPPTDCDDGNAAINPGATEINGNGIDENCDGADGVVDVDGDTYSPPTDCDDGNAAINPGATEINGNGIDENCDGADGVVDADGDTYSPPTDCDDGNASVHPGATDIPGDGIDQNCDGVDGVNPSAPSAEDDGPPPGPPFRPGDDRVNVEAGASVAIFCRSYGIHIYAIDSESHGTLVLIVTPEEIAAVDALPSENTLIASAGDIQLWRLSTGEMQVNAPGQAPEPTKLYVFIWEGCSGFATTPASNNAGAGGGGETAAVSNGQSETVAQVFHL